MQECKIKYVLSNSTAKRVLCQYAGRVHTAALHNEGPCTPQHRHHLKETNSLSTAPQRQETRIIGPLPGDSPDPTPRQAPTPSNSEEISVWPPAIGIFCFSRSPCGPFCGQGACLACADLAHSVRLEPAQTRPQAARGAVPWPTAAWAIAGSCNRAWESLYIQDYTCVCIYTSCCGEFVLRVVVEQTVVQ